MQIKTFMEINKLLTQDPDFIIICKDGEFTVFGVTCIDDNGTPLGLRDMSELLFKVAADIATELDKLDRRAREN